mgnify:CR=1 FL=1
MRATTWLAQHGITYGLVYTGEALQTIYKKVQRDVNEAQRPELIDPQILVAFAYRNPDQKPLVDVPLLVLDTVEQAGFVGRAWDTVRLWVK